MKDGAHLGKERGIDRHDGWKQGAVTRQLEWRSRKVDCWVEDNEHKMEGRRKTNP